MTRVRRLLDRFSARVGHADLRIGNTCSQIRLRDAADAAPVHAVVPDLDRRTADHLGCAPVKERHQKLDALELERAPQLTVFDVWR